ncbi:hypothetical protein NQ318_011926 [Aromia moschata]|uniref:Uncharacterized protein n=1 Tax=Aromia moschata TaxID=1265417 RepID=A0AAV8XH88_9CUCU|nr:hypothetical protein NQ318_011926 [Aromia moschata]
MDIMLSQEDIPPIIKTHKTRWIILLFYVIFSAISSFQWIQYSTVANVVMEYYNISANAFNWTQTVFTVMWPFLVFPACFIVDRKGLRVAALAGCFATAIGAVIKVFSINPNLFYVLMIGQTVVAVSQVFIWTVPSKIATTWFKPNEVSLKYVYLERSINGVFTWNFWNTTWTRTLGTLIPSTLMKNCNNLEAIGSSMYKLSINTVSVILPTAFVGGRGSKTFEYAEIMHSPLGGKRNINPVLLLSSETITTGEPSENIMEVVQEDSEGDPRHEEDQNSKIASTSVIKPKTVKHHKNENKRSKCNMLIEIRTDRKEYYKERLEIEEKKLSQKIRRNVLLEKQNVLLEQYLETNDKK